MPVVAHMSFLIKFIAGEISFVVPESISRAAPQRMNTSPSAVIAQGLTFILREDK